MAFFGRRALKVDESEAEEAPDEPPISADRLRRHTDRFKAAAEDQGEVFDEAHHARAHGALPDSLTGNAFLRLDIPLDATSDRISRGYDDLSFEPGQDPRALDEARARLLSARDRLVEELDWLPESCADLQAEARGVIRAGDLTALRRLRERTSGLARVNLAIAIAQAVPDNVDEMIGVFLDIRWWKPEATLNALDEARGRGGFRPIDPDQWDGAVTARLDAVAALVAAAFAKDSDGRGKLVKLAQQAKTDESGTRANFLDSVMRHYVAGVDETLGRLSARIDQCAARLRERPQERAQATALLSSLDLWSSYRLPLQVIEAARALDDPASAEIFRTVRTLSIDLANDHKQYETALLLVRALLHSFAHVPNCRQEMERQLPILTGNVALARLEQACARAFMRDAQFAAEVKSGALQGGTRGVTGELLSTFDESLEKWEGDPTPLFLVVRDLTIRLHNELGRHDLTPVLISWLLALEPPVEIAARLRDDLATIVGRAGLREPRVK